MDKRLFSSRQVSGITGLTSRQISYWRRTGLITPSHQTPGGHARYSFTDLISLKAARQLLDAGASLQRIRHCIGTLSRFLPSCEQPLVELSLVVTGDVVLVFHQGSAFDAISGQEWVLAIAELERDIHRWQQPQAVDPSQGELFPESLPRDAAQHQGQ